MAKKSTTYDFYGIIEDNVLMGHRTPVGGSHNIAIPEGVVKIFSVAFEGEGLESVIFPSTLKTVGREAFNHCSDLQEVIFSEGLEELGPWAFNHCESLEKIHLPASLVKIDKKNQPFNNCYGLKEITVAEANPVYCAINNCLIEKATGTVIAGCRNSVIPDDGSIKAINEGAFCRQYYLKEINIPEGVKSIGTFAFLNCRSLKEVVLPKSVTKLNVSTFEGCENLEKINLEHVERIERNAFENCKNLKGEIVISDCTTKIGTCAFELSGITSIVIGKGITAIESGTFRSCHNLKKVILPDGLTKIDKYAFCHCENLTEVVIPPSVKYIGDGAFWGCKLKDVVLPPEPDFIHKQAFAGCTLATKIERKTSNPDFEMDGTTIRKYRGKAVNVVIPDGVTAIKAKAFKGKKKMESVVIPSSVTAIASSAFEGCDNLKTITVDEGNKKYRSINNCVVDVKSKTLILGCNTSTMPESGIEKIGNGAFYNCDKLENIIIPNGVKKIGSKAFDSCTGIKTVTFPDGLESVGENAFNECKNLEAVVFGAGLKELGDYAFYKCENISELKMPKGLKTIGFGVFEYCKKLTVLDIPEGVETIDTNAFYNCDEVKVISLPSTLDYAYNAGFKYKPKLEKITVAEGNPKYKSEGNCLVYLKDNELWTGCPTTVIPEGVIRIYNKAFADTDIETLIIPEGVVVIMYEAFEGCKKLKHLTLPQTLKSPEDRFNDCINLETVTGPERFRDYFLKVNSNIKYTAID